MKTITYSRYTSNSTLMIYTIMLCITATLSPVPANAQEKPWLQIPAVKEVLAQRQKDIEALIAGTAAANPEGFTSTFVANTPDRGVVPGKEMLEFLKSGTVNYDDIELTIEYAGAHGNDMVVIMGLEIVVPGEGMTNAGKRVHRRFTDVFRKENGLWRHDLRHANVILIE